MRFNQNLDSNKKHIFNYFSPDYFIVNGEDSKNRLLLNGYSQEKIKISEALRYHDLIEFLKSKKLEIIENKSILIVGDYSNKSNQNMSDSLNKLDNNFLKEFKFTLKEHSLRKMNHLLKFEFKTSNFINSKFKTTT